MAPPTFKNLSVESPSSAPGIHIITMRKGPENRLNQAFAQEIIVALRHIERDLMKPDAPGAVIISSFSDKFWCTGLELDESDHNIYANADGFYPLLATLVDYPYPTIALITGHTFGGACPFSLSCDYRIMNSKRGFISMPPVNLGMHFDGIGALPRLKLAPQIARKMLLEAHKWTGEGALKDGIVDEICEPDKMRARAVEFAKTVAPRATMGVYGLLRSELWGEALDKFKAISYVHRKRIGAAPKVKI
jgi:Delta3-Delta2-enoyl-CoA isomerase